MTRSAHVIEFAISLVLLGLFFALPTHRKFIDEERKLYREISRRDIPTLSSDPDAVNAAYHGLNYVAPTLMRRKLESADVLLLPPDDYLEAFFPPNRLLWLEPKYRYYVAGPIETVAVSDIERATHALLVTNENGPNRVAIVPLDNGLQRQQIQRLYSQRATFP